MISHLFQRSLNTSSAPFYRVGFFQHKRFRAGLQTPFRLKGTDLLCEQNFVDIFGSRDGFALRAEAGVILCGTYTSKRWSCLHRLKPGSLKLTADALHGTSWKQKSKKKRRTVADLSFCAWRSGISFDDWAGIWFRARSAYAAQIGYNAEQADFLVPIMVNGSIGAASGDDSSGFSSESSQRPVTSRTSSPPLHFCAACAPF